MLAESLAQIWGYKQLITEVECLRKMPYDSDNENHEAVLMKLWTSLMPDTKLEVRFKL